MLPRRDRQKLEALWVEAKWRRWRDDRRAFFAEAVQVEAGKVLGGGSVRAPLALFDYQDDTLDLFERERFVVVLKARQLGLTTLSMAYALHMLLFEPGTNILLVSKDQDTADSALEMLDFMWRFLPAWLRDRAPVLEVDSVREHVWRHPDGMRSRIVSKPATTTVGAGETFDLVLWDEAALAKFPSDTYRSLKPTTNAGGSMIVFSTARGGHNQFAQMFRMAERGEGQFVSVFHPWWVSRLMNPLASAVANCEHGPCDRCVDRSLYDAEQSSYSEEPWKFHAEYPESPDEAFRQSGRSRFAGLRPVEEYDRFALRGRLEGEHQGDVEFVPADEGELRLLPAALTPPAGVKPVVTVDPATGAGGDYTAITGGWMDAEGTLLRVAFWHSNTVEPAEAARQAALLGWMLDPGNRGALMVVEKQGGYGETPIHELRHTWGYRNMYVHTYTGHRKHRQEQTFGFPMTASRRPLVIDALAKHLPALEGIDPLLRSELGAFVVRDDGKVAADVGCHDDLVMSVAIWAYVLAEVVGPSAAKADVKGEAPPDGRTLSVGSIFTEAEDIRRRQAKTNRRYLDDLKRRNRRKQRQEKAWAK